MAAETPKKNQTSSGSLPLLARAVCDFGKGNSQRLYMSELTPNGGFVLAMKPPSIGQVFTVTLYPLASPPLPAVDARVIGVRIDPADASRTGFEIVFSSLNQDFPRILAATLESLEKFRRPAVKQAVRREAERRVYPRVKVDLRAYIELSEGEALTLNVENISMSGAMLLLGDKPLPTSMGLGRQITIHLLSSGPPEHICVKAEVVRLNGPNEPAIAGVQFLDVDETTGYRIEGLILDALTGDSSWVNYRDSGNR
jgi:hypothetical protein